MRILLDPKQFRLVPHEIIFKSHTYWRNFDWWMEIGKINHTWRIIHPSKSCIKGPHKSQSCFKQGNIIFWSQYQSAFDILFSPVFQNISLNKKVLLRERKRHTDRGESCTPSVVLYGGYPPQSDLAGENLIPAGGVPHLVYVPSDLAGG